MRQRGTANKNRSDSTHAETAQGLHDAAETLTNCNRGGVRGKQPELCDAVLKLQSQVNYITSWGGRSEAADRDVRQVTGGGATSVRSHLRWEPLTHSVYSTAYVADKFTMRDFRNLQVRTAASITMITTSRDSRNRSNRKKQMMNSR